MADISENSNEVEAAVMGEAVSIQVYYKVFTMRHCHMIM